MLVTRNEFIMIITKLQGGLGNQMFQYAAGKSLSLYHKVKLAVEVSFFNDGPTHDLEFPRNFEMHHFLGFNEEIVSETNKFDLNKYPFLKQSKIQRLLPAHKRIIYKEPHYHFDKNFFNGKKQQFIKGQWQSEKFFKPFEEEIKKGFELKNEYIVNVLNSVSEMKHLETVSIHVRRGDYLRKPEILHWHGVMSKEYYLEAFKCIEKSTKVDSVYYFSDDPEWVEKELKPLIGGEVISGNKSKSQYEDFYWMSNCKHNIIANSSFSWWTAYLNKYPKKIIIAPKKWYNNAPVITEDVYPQQWIKL